MLENIRLISHLIWSIDVWSFYFYLATIALSFSLLISVFSRLAFNCVSINQCLTHVFLKPYSAMDSSSELPSICIKLGDLAAKKLHFNTSHFNNLIVLTGEFLQGRCPTTQVITVVHPDLLRCAKKHWKVRLGSVRTRTKMLKTVPTIERFWEFLRKSSYWNDRGYNFLVFLSGQIRYYW